MNRAVNKRFGGAIRWKIELIKQSHGPGSCVSVENPYSTMKQPCTDCAAPSGGPSGETPSARIAVMLRGKN